MYVPATTQPLAAAAPLAPTEIVGGTSPSAPALFTAPSEAAAVAHMSLRLRGVDLNVLAGHRASVAGSLTSRSARPGELAGRVVSLQARTPRGWRTLATAATSGRGRFRVRYLSRRPGSRLVRLTVAGDAGARGAHRLLGNLNVHRLAGANSGISRFDLCVANRENGAPGSVSYDTVNWHAVNGYDGAYSFLSSTWQAAGGGRYASDANEATPTQQTLVFNRWSRIDPGAWSATLPPCLYLR